MFATSIRGFVPLPGTHATPQQKAILRAIHAAGGSAHACDFRPAHACSRSHGGTLRVMKIKGLIAGGGQGRHHPGRGDPWTITAAGYAALGIDGGAA